MMETFILIIAAFITSSISAVLGMGGGIILLGIMAIIIPEGYMVIALHGIIQLVSNTTRTYVFKVHLKKDILKEFGIGVMVGLSASAIIIFTLIQLFNVESANQIKVDFLKPIIGLFIIWYLFLKGPKKEKHSKSFIGVGALSGVSSVFVGATGPLIAPFFLGAMLTKENIIANKAACQMMSHFGKIPLFIIFFKFNYIQSYDLLLPMVVAVFVGTNVGKKILSFIPEKLFKQLFRLTLLLIAIRLIVAEFI
ncbi:MAG: sulfite exporter TauE/SafE family protein [Candidatus Marinimicrobia bacterium]|nr:sulfite exporter TauE/SafE family protein [Candidatus Neomarinimicrobiota bacterium]MBT6870902.1 sulfite exporter TauE/SafE family protein [Candidatus Neomarinimicrobiota bacterium]MBT7378155.1 sulfite exporter TauE/SafE family protein [Candidatus Neomarinimicrobiota bacterium]